MPELTRDELGRHLVATRIAGSVQTPVADVLRKAELLAAGDPDHSFGLSGMTRYSPADVLEQVRLQFGWTHTEGEPSFGSTWIDPELLLDELDRAAARLRRAAENGERVVFASGHPTGVLALHQQVCTALRNAGAKVPRPGDGIAFRLREHRRQVRYVQYVAVLSSGANLYHTHDSHPMELVLDQADDLDLVVGDHGWAGAAAERGIDVIGIADINDPALPMARAEGRARVVLPMDDNVLPIHYDPVVDYLIARLS
jgi:Phosphatase